LEINAAKRSNSVPDIKLGILLITAATRNTRRASRRDEIWPKDVKKFRAGDQLPVNFKRGHIVLVVLRIKILQFNGPAVVKAKKKTVRILRALDADLVGRKIKNHAGIACTENNNILPSCRTGKLDVCHGNTFLERRNKTPLLYTQNDMSRECAHARSAKNRRITRRNDKE